MDLEPEYRRLHKNKSMENYIKRFRDISEDDLLAVGSENILSKERCKKSGVIQKGFVVTAAAFRHFIDYNKLDGIHSLLLERLDKKSLSNLKELGAEARELILHARMPDDLANAISTSYQTVFEEQNPGVDIQCSAIAVDSPKVRFEGYQPSFSNVCDRQEIIEDVKKCFASLYSDEAISYRVSKGIANDKIYMSVGIQLTAPVKNQSAAPPQSEIQFLDGPQSRWKEFKFTFNTLFQFIKGFRALHFVGPCITFFGSARFQEDHEYYKLTRRISAEVAKLGFTIMTGGGPGLMEAANRGARDVGGKSIGCNIKLPVEQSPNIYLDKWVSIKHFFVRKILLVKYSYAFIVMPGGYGTMDEYFEALTLIQTGKINNFPIIIFCKDFHRELVNHIELMKNSGAISENDMQLFLITDSVQEAVELIKERCIKHFGLTPKPNIIPHKWLLEK